MPPITQYGSFTKQIADQINQNISAAGIGFLNGNVILLDPFHGVDTNDGITAPVQTLGRAYGIGREGKNDVIALISNGLTTSTARVNSAFVWAKNALHLVGVSSGINISNRSRVAPSPTQTAFANFFTVSGSGCLFNNVEWFHGFNTGTTSAIAMTISGGGRNMFSNCHIAGMGDTASAQSSGSRDLKIVGVGENMFVNSTIGLDTVSSNTSNASFELTSGTVRNQFVKCTFLRYTSSATTLIGTVATGGIDRSTTFDSCKFINAIKSGSTTMTAAFTLAASAGGMFVMDPLCQLVGISAFGTDATSLAQILVGGAAVNSGAGKSVASA